MAEPDIDQMGSEVQEEIHRDLVETLFDTPGSFIVALIGGPLAPVSAWFMTGDGVYLCLTAVMLVVAAYRVQVLIAHSRAPLAARRKDARRWEILYGIGGVGFVGALGVTVAILFQRHPDDVAFYYGLVLMMSGVGALAGRNAGSPPIVLAQVITLCMPLAVVSVLHPDKRYWGVALILVLETMSIRSVSKFLYRNLQSALSNGRDADTQRRRFKSALNSMTHGLCMGRADMTLTVVNRRLHEFFGLDPDAAPKNLAELTAMIAKSTHMSREDAQIFLDQWTSRASLPRTDVFSREVGDRIYDFRCEPADNGAFVTVVEDVTEQRRAAREIERIAHFDTLTDLANRFQFQQRLERDLRHIRKRGLSLAMLCIDLDQFKEVNDTLGHTIGDLLLCAVAERLRDCVRSVDMVARFGGDEFCILMHPTIERPPADALAARVIEAIGRPYVIEGHTIVIGASVGLCVAPRDAASAEGLLKCGDLAMYHSKAAGRRQAIWFETAMEDALLNKRRIERELREALRNETLEVHYQPIFDARDQSVSTCEALTRWRHPQLGYVPPSAFIPIAEETGMIVELGEWVLRRACRDARLWPTSARVAVNFSSRQFQQPDMIERVRNALRAAELEPERLEIEITESTLMQDTEDAAAKIEALRALGVRLSLDDFGTGFSSLGYLNRFPVDKVKLDRSFVSELSTSGKTQAIVGAVSLLTAELGIDLVAEGVETHEQRVLLLAKNVYLMQGFLFSMAKPQAELAQIFSGAARGGKLKVVA
ncbi:MAG TPA: EAL domain-containing protein [Methylosinus sp.]|jgi:diguanylate cyclase (GGDEF)-like protein|uniref:putative bifunctional diguanylate cyclase/phosphodiesterase n=1 Tax=Methylosinus sp. TaxID=427 RepID=UPI002F94DBCB